MASLCDIIKGKKLSKNCAKSATWKRVSDPFVFAKNSAQGLKNLVSGNPVDGKNLHPGGRKFCFFNWFSGDIIFSLIYFAFLYFFTCLFFEIKNIFWYTFDYAGRWVIKFSPHRFPEIRLLFWPNLYFEVSYSY